MALLPGFVSGSFRGIGFHVPSGSNKAGRRVAEVFLPGVDGAAYDDFGKAPREISIEGLIVGDDYLVRGAALEAAFEIAGPGMLVHPFRGPMLVILVEPGTVSYSDSEMRLARFSARFKTVESGFEAGSSGLLGIASAVLSVIALASALSSAVQSNTISAAKARSAVRSSRITKEVIADLQPVTGSRRFVPRLNMLLGRTSISSPSDYNDAVVQAASMVGDATLTPWISAAAESSDEDAPEASALLSLGVGVSEALVSAVADAPAEIDSALLMAGAAHFLVQAISQIDYIGFDSTEVALQTRASSLAAIDGIVGALEGLTSAAFSGEVSELVRGLYALKVEVTATVNEIIGRLPRTLGFELDVPLSAYMLANHVAGDDPAQLQAVYEDVVSRNDPRHPSRLPIGTVKVVRP